MTSNRPYLLRAVHEWISDNGLTPYVVVDAAHPGLEVPPQAVSEGRVVLNLAPRAVARLEIDNEAITFMARFGGVSHAVTVPIAAVQAIYARENGQGMLLAADAAGSVGPTGSSGSGGEQSTPVKPASPGLQAVPTAGQQDATAEPGRESGESASGDDSNKPRPKGKPNLHVVK